MNNVTYGIGEIEGLIYNDNVYLSDFSDKGAKVNFLAVYEAKNLSGIESDGLLGLSPK
jgi:hypothetical protein